jgi:hypothetical protein
MKDDARNHEREVLIYFAAVTWNQAKLTVFFFFFLQGDLPPLLYEHRFNLVRDYSTIWRRIYADSLGAFVLNYCTHEIFWKSPIGGAVVEVRIIVRDCERWKALRKPSAPTGRIGLGNWSDGKGNILRVMSAKKNLRGKKSDYVAGQEMSAFLDVTLVNGRFTALIFFSLWKLSCVKRVWLMCTWGLILPFPWQFSMVFWCTDHCFLA